MLWLLNAQLDHDTVATAPQPTRDLLLAMGLLLGKEPTEADDNGLKALFTKAVAMTATVCALPPCSSCGLRHGCGVTERSGPPRLPGRAGLPAQLAVFRFSAACTRCSLLFLRSSESAQAQQRLLATETVSRWSQGGAGRYRYNVSVPTSSAPCIQAERRQLPGRAQGVA